MLNNPPPQKGPRPPISNQRPPDDPGAQRPQRQMIMIHFPVVRPLLTYLLIGVNAAVFVLAFYMLSPFDLDRLYDWGANNGRFVLQFGEFYRLTTAMFLHGNAAHIVFNMMSLYYIGTTIERFFGHFRFGVIYFLGGLAGSITSALLNNPDSFSVGASGAVFGIFGAEMIYLYRHRKLLGEGGRAQLRSLVIIAVLNLAVGIASTLNTTGVVIDNWAHIGGFVGGALLTWLIGPLFIFGQHPDRPGAYIAEDINPLERRYQTLLIFISGLLLLLIIGTIIAQ